MSRSIVIIAAILVVCQVQLGNSHKILCVFPSPSISHQFVFRGLTLALNKRGHELVVVTTDPINDPSLKNYREIDIGSIYKAWSATNHVENRRKAFILDQMKDLSELFFHNVLDTVLSNSDFKKLYAPENNDKFDLMLVEMLFWPGVLPLAKRFDVPTIGISSLGLTIHNHYQIGNPSLTSHPSNWEFEYRLSDKLSFWQRLVIFIDFWRYIYWYKTSFIAGQYAIAKKHFGNDIPDLGELEKNVSLVFVNQQGPISYVRPLVPKVIEIGGFHVSKQISDLPKDLKEILDGATAGFVYMSLGTNVKSTMLPNKTVHEFMTAFSRLPYEVLWKFENETLPGKPDNVHIMKWVPQQAVLAHPNLKVFIYQGGLQSTEEAVAHAVPLIGFPVMGDQETQVSKMVSIGVAVKLEISAMDGNELYETITAVATDTRYKEKMLNLRSLVEDKPQDPLENAVWWTEHVIRHRGAPHLHSSTADEPWYTRQDMDIVAFISAAFVIVLYIVLFISCQAIKKICNFSVRSSKKKSKIN